MNPTAKNMFRLTQAVCRATARNTSSSANVVTSPRYSQLKTLQESMCVEDGIPIHLKTGFKDRALYLATFGLIGVGVAGGLHTIYKIVLKL